MEEETTVEKIGSTINKLMGYPLTGVAKDRYNMTKKEGHADLNLKDCRIKIFSPQVLIYTFL
jgi:hypothetical protein